MALTRSSVVIVFVGLLIASPVSSQTARSTREEVTLERVHRLRAETEKDPTLAEDLRTQILELYGIGVGSLETAANNRAAASDFERERSGIDTIVRSLRAELEKPEQTPQIRQSSDLTVAQAEDALTRERARLAANRSALRNQERLTEDRTKTRNDIARRLGELDLEIELLDDELRKQAGSAMRTELKTAVRLSALARKEAAASEIGMLRARLDLLNDRSSLIPMETDLVQRRVSYSQELVSLLERATHDLRIEQAQAFLSRVQDQSHTLSQELPLIAPLAAETVALAETLWSLDGVITRSERTIKAIDDTRHHQAQLNRIADLTSRKFEAYGHRGSITRWWPDLPKDFPEPGVIANNIQKLDEEIPEVEHRLIIYEQQRSKAVDLTRQTMLDLQNEFGGELDPTTARRVRDLLAVRQDILDDLILRVGRYSNQLVEYRTASNRFLNQVRDVERFLYSHILWSRSVPRPIIPRLRDIGPAMRWLNPTSHLQSLSIVGAEFHGTGLAAGLFLVVIILLRQPMRHRLHSIAERVSDPEQDSLFSTIRALLLSLLLAAPLPIALYMAGSLARLIGSSAYWHASAEAFFELAMVAALLELVRQVFAPDGLAEAHFSWPTHATRPLYRGLLLIEGIGLPVLYVALHLAFAGMRLDSPDDLQLYNNSLGRLAFIAAVLLFGLSILAILRPERKKETSDQEMWVPWPRQFSGYAFPTAFLGAYPIIILTTIVPAILAVTGFYVTGMLLGYQMLRTLLLGLVVMVGGGLVHRWRIVNRNRAILEASEEVDEEQQENDLEAAENQVRHLFRFGVIAVLAIGLFSIWSDALPMLQLLKRVQILPRIEMLEPLEDTAAVLGVQTDIAEQPAEEETGSSAAKGTVLRRSLENPPPMPLNLQNPSLSPSGTCLRPSSPGWSPSSWSRTFPASSRSC